ncbi:hypothetical protein BDFB_010702 [Asbolus verrucosus]|uniref:Uncharacterized protein n=1 Tax=Asbolus verrucosus TaxID=1661398 RepID=A0A482V7V3_ASBVE|nr:hypothetical protein BDFB_010702 [Asbolus verrucosus]
MLSLFAKLEIFLQEIDSSTFPVRCAETGVPENTTASTAVTDVRASSSEASTEIAFTLVKRQEI